VRLEKDGFRLTQKAYILPSNCFSLDPLTKRKATICNLFANHELPINEIARVLDEKLAHVIDVLANEGLITDRRTRQSYPVRIERRESRWKSKEPVE
jgi:hypothetical protein